jgi:hypothetical protein
MQRTLSITLVLLAGVFCCGQMARAAEVPVFPPPPRLATTAQELARIKAAPDFAAVRDAAVRRADALLEKPVVVPEGYGGWIFYYACPDDGATLQPLSPTQHQCPLDKKIYTDERTVAAYRARLHYAAEDAAQTLGWAYAYTGDEKYVAEVKRILLKLAHDYPSYPARLDRWGHTGLLAPLGGRRYVQSLDEAVGIIKLAKSYDLTRTCPLWSEADKQEVEKNLFGLTAATLLTFNQDINNHQTWYNAGLMAIASVTGDTALAEKVLTMRGGFRDQLARSVGADGLWYEGTMAYHNYALQAMREIVEAGQRLGLPLQNEPKLRAMIEGPLHATYPNGQFPAINDSDPGSITMFNGAFEWAWETYHDPLFAQAAAWKNPQKLAELLGADAQPVWPLSTKSEALPDAGLAILRQGRDEAATCLFLDYGPHGDGHGHYDKLNLMLFANGREWLLDPGRLTYSHKEYQTWVKETAAHNTVALGGRSQQATTGKLLFLRNDKNFAACAAQSDGAYPGAKLTRYLLLTDKMLVDVFDVEAAQQTQIDWFAHAVAASLQPVEVPGASQPPGTGQPASPGAENGYQHLTDALSWPASATRWEFLSEAGNPAAPRLRVWLADEPDEEIFSANGIGYTVGQKTPTLIRRRHTQSARFVTVYDLSGTANYVRGAQVEKGEQPRLRVATSDGPWSVAFDAAGASLVSG